MICRAQAYIYAFDICLPVQISGHSSCVLLLWLWLLVSPRCVAGGFGPLHLGEEELASSSRSAVCKGRTQRTGTSPTTGERHRISVIPRIPSSSGLTYMFSFQLFQTNPHNQRETHTQSLVYTHTHTQTHTHTHTKERHRFSTPGAISRRICFGISYQVSGSLQNPALSSCCSTVARGPENASHSHF